jgi:hypothetical protein
MKFKFTALVAIIAVTFLISGCDQSANQNTVANANTNANTNVPIVSTSTPVPNTNQTPTTRRAPTREDYERNKEQYSKEAKDSGRKVGTGLNDGWLWVKTRFDLAAVDDLRDSTINVDVDNAVVTLTGTVANQAQVAKADQTAKAVEGVKGVKNMLKVAAANANSPNANIKTKTK